MSHNPHNQKMNAVGFLDTSGIHYPAPRHNLPEELFPQQPFVWNFTSLFSCCPDENPPQIDLTSVYALDRK
jgi:hypothetical protein